MLYILLYLSKSLTYLPLPIQECSAWKCAEHRTFSFQLQETPLIALTTEDFLSLILCHLIWEISRCFTQTYCSCVCLKKRSLQYDKDKNGYTILLFTSAISSHRMLKLGPTLITTKYCNLASHSVNSLHQSSCWNLSMLWDFVLLGVISKSRRRHTFDLWGILSQYKLQAEKFIQHL